MRTTMTLLSLTLPALGAIGFAPAAAWASPVTILESNAERLVVRVESPQLRRREMEAPDGRVYMAGTAEGFGEGAVGQPRVPVLGSWILIPNGRQARITAVEADSASARQTGGVLLEPTQPPRPDLQDAPLPPFAIDESSYGRDADYPGSYARLDEPQMMRGQACALLWLHPYGGRRSRDPGVQVGGQDGRHRRSRVPSVHELRVELGVTRSKQGLVRR